MWEQINSNQRKSAMLVVLMAFFMLVMGLLLGEMLAPGAGRVLGVGIALILWFVLSLVAYFQGGNIMLAVAGARKISHDDHPRLFNVVEEMKIAASLPKMPEVYIIDDPSPNAFAAGRDPEHAAVAVTTGLLNLCNRDELQGVIAHEMAHIRNRDVLLMVMVGVMLGTIVILADIMFRSFLYGGGGRSRTSSRSRDNNQAQLLLIIVALLLSILAPLLAQIIYFAVSRKREYLADACAAQFTRYPEGLASALEKIGGAALPLAGATRATAPMYIANPFGQKGMAASGLTATHPSIAERVKILRGMAGGAGFSAYQAAYEAVTRRPGVIPAAALAAPEAAAPKRAAAAAEDRRERVRENTDMLWKMNQYAFVSCTCGLKLKVPPGFQASQVECPGCGRRHNLPGRAA